MSEGKTLYQEFSKGLLHRHPVFKMTLALCTTLAVSTRIENGVAMGAATIFALMASNGVISLIGPWVPEEVRIPSFLVVIATFVTLADLTLGAFLPGIHAALGIYLPLVTVNCIVLARADGFASKNPVAPAVADGLGMGLGYTWGILAISAIREGLGTGAVALAGFRVSAPVAPLEFLVQPAGGFLVIGLFLAALTHWRGR